MTLVRPITRRDITGPALCGPIRDDYRRYVIELERPRRVLLGDHPHHRRVACPEATRASLAADYA